MVTVAASHLAVGLYAAYLHAAYIVDAGSFVFGFAQSAGCLSLVLADRCESNALLPYRDAQF